MAGGTPVLCRVCGYYTTPAAGVSRTLPPVARLWDPARQAARAQVFCGYYTIAEGWFANGFRQTDIVKLKKDA